MVYEIYRAYYNLRNVGAVTREVEQLGRSKALGDFPYAVFEDEQELRRYAEEAYAQWWEGLIPGEDDPPEDQHKERRRVFAAAFSGGYLDEVAKRSDKEGNKGQGLLSYAGVKSRVVGKRDVEDGVLYEVEFVDPARMTKPVSFGIRVEEDGEVEVSEL